MPTLDVGGVAHVLQHPRQAAELLGLATPSALRDARKVAWDVDTLVDAWLELVRDFAFLMPTKVILDVLGIGHLEVERFVAVAESLIAHARADGERGDPGGGGSGLPRAQQTSCSSSSRGVELLPPTTC